MNVGKLIKRRALKRADWQKAFRASRNSSRSVVRSTLRRQAPSLFAVDAFAVRAQSGWHCANVRRMNPSWYWQGADRGCIAYPIQFGAQNSVTVPTAFTMGTEDRRNGLPMSAHDSIPDGSEQVDAYFMGYLSADLSCGDGAVVRAHGLAAKEVCDYVDEQRFNGLVLHPNALGVKPAPACETAAMSMKIALLHIPSGQICDVEGDVCYVTFNTETDAREYIDSALGSYAPNYKPVELPANLRAAPQG